MSQTKKSFLFYLIHLIRFDYDWKGVSSVNVWNNSWRPTYISCSYYNINMPALWIGVLNNDVLMVVKVAVISYTRTHTHFYICTYLYGWGYLCCMSYCMPNDNFWQLIDLDWLFGCLRPCLLLLLGGSGESLLSIANTLLLLDHLLFRYSLLSSNDLFAHTFIIVIAIAIIIIKAAASATSIYVVLVTATNM